MTRRTNIATNLDWISVLIWLVIMAFGWMNIYSANIMDADQGIFDLSQRFGKQIIWISAAIILAILLLVLDAKFYIFFSYLLYGLLIFLLLAVLLFGKEINGAKSWFIIGGFQFQPSEFAKPLTALALARLLTSYNFELRRFWDLSKAGAIILAPPLLIMLQPDLGSTLVYFSFIFVLFREGFSSNTMLMLAALIFLFIATLLLDKVMILLIIIGVSLIIYLIVTRSLKKTTIILFSLTASFWIFFAINYLLGSRFSLFQTGLISLVPMIISLLYKGLEHKKYNLLKILAGALIAVVFIITVDYGMNNILKPHQRHRIYVTLGLENDPQGVGYNLNQSKIAIGSGGFSGKGYLNSTQIKYGFVPEPSTDFIFCNVGEEWGFLGASFVVILYVGLLLRLVFLAERQRTQYSRIFGYSLVSVLFVHFLINVGMTIGLLPVIGIPLPFFSYGGSSLWAFTMFLFIFLRLDASRLENLA